MLPKNLRNLYLYRFSSCLKSEEEEEENEEGIPGVVIVQTAYLWIFVLYHVVDQRLLEVVDLHLRQHRKGKKLHQVSLSVNFVYIRNN